MVGIVPVKYVPVKQKTDRFNRMNFAPMKQMKQMKGFTPME